MPDTQEIVISIDERLAEARQEIASLEAALVAFSGETKTTRTQRAIKQAKGSASAPKATPAHNRATRSANGSAPKPKAVRVKPGRRQRTTPAKAVEVVPAGKLEKLLGSSEGLTTTALAEQAGGDRNQVLVLLREMEGAGQVRRTGERRGTRWHVITDEDRVAARAAELAAQSKRARARKT